MISNVMLQILVDFILYLNNINMSMNNFMINLFDAMEQDCYREVNNWYRSSEDLIIEQENMDYDLEVYRNPIFPNRASKYKRSCNEVCIHLI